MLLALVIEREPMRWQDLLPAALLWLQNAGTLAALGLLLYFLIGARGSFARMFRGEGKPTPAWLVNLGKLLTLASWGLFAALALLSLSQWVGLRPRARLAELVFCAAGACALIVVFAPVVLALLKDTRFARIWAVARLSVKEQIRNRGVAVFGAIVLIILFADWFVPYKAEDQVRNYVRILYWSIWPLYILVAAVLGSFSLPTDIKTLTIHTVVTKPITKFEVVLGRYLGYAVLLSVSLAIVAGVSLVYIWRGVTDEARKESLTARVATYGRLGFHGTKGDSVGREWDYRKYIGGQHMSGSGSKQYAFWLFDDLSDVRARPGSKTRTEFTFDIFRLTKGTENRGVFCTFLFTDGAGYSEKDGILNIAQIERKADEVRKGINDRLDEEGKKAGPGFDRLARRAQLEVEFAKSHGLFEFAGEEVTDYQTQSIDIPFELIEKFRAAPSQPDKDGFRPAPMMVLVSIDRDRGSAAQMLGMARYDLYVLAAENDFFVNFLKGILGLWFSVLLVLGMAVALSTYLSGVIALLCTLFLFLAGLFTPDIVQLAENRSFGGGFLESATRIVTRTPIAAPLEDSPATALVRGFDDLFRWWLRLFLKLLPDVDRYDLHAFVANGFDISWTQVLLTDNFLALLGYLVPWGVLAFYLIRIREIANPM